MQKSNPPITHPNSGSVPIFLWPPRADRRRPIFTGLAGEFPPAQRHLIGEHDLRMRLGWSKPCDKAVIETAFRLTKANLYGSSVRKAVKGALFRGYYHWLRRFLAQYDNAFLVLWAGFKGRGCLWKEVAQSQGMPVLHLDWSPLPDRMQLDFRGLNHESSLPRDIAFYYSWLEGQDIEPTSWKRLRTEIKPRLDERRDDVKQVDATTNLAAENYIFCPLQTRCVFGDWVTSIGPLIDVLHAASRRLPENWHLRLKEHPSSKVNFRERIMRLEDERFRLDNTTDTRRQVAAAHAIVTLDSSVGVWAFFYDKPVLVLARALYGFGGMANKLDSAKALCDALCDPHALSFDAEARNAFMSFLVKENWFPKFDDVIAGRYTIGDVIARDCRMQALREQYQRASPVIANMA